MVCEYGGDLGRCRWGPALIEQTVLDATRPEQVVDSSPQLEDHGRFCPEGPSSARLFSSSSSGVAVRGASRRVE
jgi:hypothetical protein